MELFEVISSDYHGFFISQERPCNANLSSPSKNGGLSDEAGLHFVLLPGQFSAVAALHV